MGSARGALVICCFLPLIVIGKPCQKVKLTVPKVIYAGALIGKVNLKSCMHPNEVIGGSNNPDFVVEHVDSLYAIYATKRITMPSHAVKFGILLLNPTTKTENIITVKLVTKTEIGKSRNARELLKRTKRRWRPMPFSIQENYRGKYPCHVQQVQSDTQLDYDITYSMIGQGVDQTPVGLFEMNQKTGDIYVTAQVDREEYPFFQLIVYAKTPDGFAPENPLDLMIIVEDDNDNAPQFTEEMFCAEVLEQSKKDAVVGRVNATDRDDPNTRHTLLRYILIQQIPPTPVMFAVNPEYGIVTTISNKLDREVQDHYTLIIEVRDMGGGIGYLSSTGTMSITILDINDFPPTFTQQKYQTEVNENESGIVILKIPVTDKDLVNSANWRAVYSITQGNEKGHFNISTDPNTNEGLLRVIKGINYEEDKRFLLQVAVANEVSLITQSGTKSSGVSTVPVTVIVKDVDEGPECQPRIKEARVKENQTIGSFVTEYQATDPETKSNTGIRYTILSDPNSWVNINEGTGRITTAKVLDYESDDAPNHQYTVTFLATDQTGKSGTCTLMIALEDVNDNFPVISRSDTNVCRNAKTSLAIQAKDADSSLNSQPYTFSFDSGTDQTIRNNWRLVPQDGNSVQLEEIGNLPNGYYNIPLMISDRQGHGSTQILNVRKCDCADSLNCSSRSSDKSAALGGLAILVMVLSALLFAALLCILLACLCGAGASKGKLGFPDDAAQQNLIVTNTEAPGADVLDPNFKVPVHIANPNVSGNAPNGSYDHGGQNVNISGGQHVTQTTKIRPLHSESTGVGLLPSYRGGQQMMESNRHTYAEWQSFMNTHLGDKLYMCGQDEEHQHGEDYVVPYNYEGKGSVAGSVGCCSELRGEDDRMDFLNQLEPKFRTLAEVCAKK